MPRKAPRPEGSRGANRPGVDFRGQQKSAPTYHNPSPKQRTLAREYWCALQSTRFADLAPLRQAGVGGPGLAVGPALACVRVANETFVFDDEAASAFVIPVRVENHITPEVSDPVQTVRD